MRISIHHATERGERFETYAPGNKLQIVWTGMTKDLGVADNDVGDAFLNDVYRIFNIEHPESYKARSLSVGDLIQIADFFFAVEKAGFRHVPKWEVYSGNNFLS